MLFFYMIVEWNVILPLHPHSLQVYREHSSPYSWTLNTWRLPSSSFSNRISQTLHGTCFLIELAFGSNVKLDHDWSCDVSICSCNSLGKVYFLSQEGHSKLPVYIYKNHLGFLDALQFLYCFWHFPHKWSNGSYCQQNILYLLPCELCGFHFRSLDLKLNTLWYTQSFNTFLICFGFQDNKFRTLFQWYHSYYIQSFQDYYLQVLQNF